MIFSHLCLCVTGVIFSVVQTNPKIAQALQTLLGEKIVVTSALVVVKNPMLAAGSGVGIKMADGGVEQGPLCIPCFLMDCSSLLCVCTSTPSLCCLSISFPDSQELHLPWILLLLHTSQCWQSSASPAGCWGWPEAPELSEGFGGQRRGERVQLQKAPCLGTLPAVLKCRAACGLSLSGIIGF